MIFGNPPPERVRKRRPDAGPRAPQPSPSASPKPIPFDGLDHLLLVLTIFNVFAVIISVLAAFTGGGGIAVAFVISSFGGVIACSLGRVLIFIAQTLDRIAEQGRGLGQGPQ